MSNVSKTANALETAVDGSPAASSPAANIVSALTPLELETVVSSGVVQTEPQEMAKARKSCLLHNGSFEHGLTHWITFAGTEQISKTDAYIGMAALVLSTLESGTSQNVVATPGAIYQLIGYGRSTASDYSSFGMTFFNAQGSLLLRSDVGNVNASSWQDYFTVAIAPTHTAYVQVWTYQSCDRGVTHLDGLSLKQISEDDIPPTQVSPFFLINAPLAATDTTFSCHGFSM